MKKIIWAVGLLLLVSCSSQFSTLKQPDSSTSVIYTLSEDEALDIAKNSMMAVLNKSVAPIDKPYKGYFGSYIVGLDTYSQQVVVIPAIGTSTDGKQVRGFYFEVSGSGTSFVRGKIANRNIYEKIEDTLKASGKGVSVVNVTPTTYISTPTLNSPASSTSTSTQKLRDLKKLRDEGLITNQDYEAQKKILLQKY